MFELVDIQGIDFFEWTPHHNTRDHNLQEKLYSASQIHLFSECVVNVWNNLPASVDFKSLSSFKCTVKRVDLFKFLKCFKMLTSYVNV